MATSLEKQPLPKDLDHPQQMVQQISAKPQQCDQFPLQPTIVLPDLQISQKRYEHYNGFLSIILGISLLGLIASTAILNGTDLNVKLREHHDWTGVQMILLLPCVWCGPMIVVSGAFAIAAGRSKSRCLVTTHLVLGSLGCIMAFIYMCFTLGSMLTAIDSYSSESSKANTKSLAFTVVWLLVTMIIFIVQVSVTVLPCKVACCGKTTETLSVVMITAVPHDLPVYTVSPPEGAKKCNPEGAEICKTITFPIGPPPYKSTE